MGMGCTARVVDYTDTIECGEFILRGNRCARHLHEEVRHLTRKIESNNQANVEYARRIAELTTESG